MTTVLAKQLPGIAEKKWKRCPQENFILGMKIPLKTVKI